MSRACPRCHKAFEPSRSGGLCPHCGHSSSLSRMLFTGLAACAVFACVLGVGLLFRPLGTGKTGENSGAKPEPFVPVETEFAAAKATIRAPREWRLDRQDADSVAFVNLATRGTAIRFFAVPAAKGRDAHLALIRQRVPNAEPVEHALPEWPGGEALAVKLPGDARLGASWLIPRGDQCIQVFFWGSEETVADVGAFREGIKFREEPPAK